MGLLKAGDAAPDFSLRAHDGTAVRLSDLRGQYVLLWFYPKADTPGCTIEGKGFRDRITDIESMKTVVLGISFDTVDENHAFADKCGFPFKLLCDTSRAVGLAFGAADAADAGYARRISFLIDPAGQIVRAYEKVNPQTHVAQVLEDLSALVSAH
jgi:thioredoxin-dependent peroxiredoxin